MSTLEGNKSRKRGASGVLEVLKDTYEVHHVLGEGALGRTYLATDTSRGRQVAIKELLPSRMKRWKDFELFHRECSTLRDLSHPGIPAYYEDFVIEPEEQSSPARLFLVQAFVEGENLQDLLDGGMAFDEPKVRDIVTQVLEILDYLHTLNPAVIHRDIKPSNLMLRPDGRVVMIDFGAVREAMTSEGLGSTIVGTHGYMPPEQYAGQGVPGTDIFALGATCVQLLSGLSPTDLFEGLHVFRLPADLPVTLGFEKVLLKMTEPEVEDRFQSAAAVLKELQVGFLMVPKDSITGVLPIPHDIRPAPRPFPGFQLRDAYHGMSHLSVLVWSVFGVLLSLVLPITALVLGQPAWSILGFSITIGTLATAGVVSLNARRQIGVYRRGQYTLGEVTGRFYSELGSNRFVHLTYRYRVGEGFCHGSISTRDRAYRTLTPGEPVGVLFLPDEPKEHVLYAVPQRWAQRQMVTQSRLSGPEPR